MRDDITTVYHCGTCLPTASQARIDEAMKARDRAAAAAPPPTITIVAPGGGRTGAGGAGGTLVVCVADGPLLAPFSSVSATRHLLASRWPRARRTEWRLFDGVRVSRRRVDATAR